jgi:hypothetical protein
MNTDKISLEKENEPSCLGAVISRFKCENCGWIGTQSEMFNEQDIDYNQDSCKECKQVMIDNRYDHIYCERV